MNYQMFLAGGIVFAFAFWPFSNKVELARSGKTEYVVVQSENATDPEKFAVQELTNFLGRVTGASFPVVSESALAGKTRGIYVGWTEFAARNGIEASKLGEEEWIIRTVGKNLVLAGGRPRGTMYAVYEFLERQIGCHWLDKDTEVVPSKPALTLAKLDIRGKPWFWRRQCGGELAHQPGIFRFLVRNKTYRDTIFNRGPYSNDVPQGAFYKLDGYPGCGHSFSYYVNASNWFATHPEYFALDASGKRLPAYDGAGPGQLCLTHPDVRRLTKESLRKFIAKDRDEAAAKGCPPPRVYMIGQNDKYDAHCKCTNCQVIAKREDSESGPLIDFINEIAEDIEKDYPDILIQTYAYNLTQVPPKTIKPRDNVLVGWCDVYTQSEVLRPLSHQCNAKHYNEIKRWGEISAQPAIGDDYWILFGLYSSFPLPWTMVQCVGPDLKLFADCGVKSFYAEAYRYLEPGENFIALKFWLAYQLLVNPYQPTEPLIKTFMDGYYGSAAPAMNAYLNYLMQRIDRDAQYMAYRNAPHNLAYLDLDFFIMAEKMFDDAESSVKPGGLEARHVLLEHFVVDSALLYLWPWLERKLAQDQTMPFDHAGLIERFKKGWSANVKHQFNAWYTPGYKIWYNSDGKRMDRIVALFRDPQMPEQFSKLPRRDVADFNWLTFSSYGPSQKFVVDSEAVGGMAAEPAGISAIMAAEKGAPADGAVQKPLSKSLTFGVTGGPTVTLKPDDIPQDGKYHLYKIGIVKVKPQTMVWAIEGRKLGVCVDRIYEPGATNENANLWNAYISLKVKGPVFVQGSTETNGIWMDRVLMVKPRPGEKPDPSELKRMEEKKKREASLPQVKVPRLAAAAGGDPAKVDWGKAAVSGKWSKLDGSATDRKINARFVHDGEWLYLQLMEEGLVKPLISGSDIFSGDDWELLFAAKRGEEPYRQIGIGPGGVHIDLAYGESSRAWESEVKVKSETDGKSWKVSLGFPMDRLLPVGVKTGETIFANILRGGSEPLAWSPTFESSFHELDRLGEIIIE
ncbi:MAG: DUF4838 domain-containing protein [Kiritimatiellia bacterium]